MLCRVHLTDYTQEEKELLDYLFFHPYDKLEERESVLVMNYGGGKTCPGTNDFGEKCKACRYAPYLVRKILQRQDNFNFG